MSEIGNFSDLASIKGNTVERPKSLPTAPYIAMFNGPFKEHKSAKKGTLAMRFPIRLQGSHDDAVQDEISSDPKLQKALERDYNVDFWMTPDSLWRFTEFAKSMGVSEDLDLISMAEQLISEGQPFLIQGTAEPAQDGSDNTFFRLDNPAPLP